MTLFCIAAVIALVYMHAILFVRSRVAKTAVAIGMPVALLAAMWLHVNWEYYRAKRHADAIIAGSEELMSLVPADSDATILLSASDPRIPRSLCALDPVYIDVSNRDVYIYTGGHSGKGFFVYQTPPKLPPLDGQDVYAINDRLWWFVGH